MDRLEILKKAKEKVDALVAEKLRAEQSDSMDEKATEMAIEMQKHDSLISAIEQNYISPDELARAFTDAVSQIQVQVPPITVPDIQIPNIEVPKAEVTVNIPEIKLPTINVPEPKVTVNVPDVKIPPFPAIQMPDSMEIHGDVGLFGYGFNNPLPVQLRDANGNPINLADLGGGMVSGGGGRFVKVMNDASEPIPISGSITSTPGATYFASDAVGSVNIVQSIPLNVSISGASGTIGVVTINPDGLPVYGGAGSASSVSVTDIFGTVGTNVVNPDGRIKVELPTGSSGLTDTELRANSIDVQQASGASWSTNVLTMPAVTVTSITNSTAITLLNGEGIARDTWGATQVGTWNVTGITNSLASSLIDSSGIQYSGSNPVPITWVSGAGVSTQVNISDSTGVGYSGSNPLPITGTVVVSSITASTASALVDSTGVQYSGSNPIPTKEVRSVTPSQTSPSVGVTSTSILASNTSRLGATIYNEGSAICYTKLGVTASLTSYTLQIASGGYYEVPFGYTGAIDGITSASTAQLRVTEIT